MKKQKRFSNQFEIEFEILKARRDITKLEADAIVLEKEVKALQAAGIIPECYEVKQELVKKYRTRAASIQDVKLPMFKDLLAAFKTQTFGFMEGDKSVVMEAR